MLNKSFVKGVKTKGEHKMVTKRPGITQPKAKMPVHINRTKQTIVVTIDWEHDVNSGDNKSAMYELKLYPVPCP